MRLLLDTHAFILAITEPEQLTPQVREWLSDPGVERWVSVVSLWEIAIKAQIGKLALPLERRFYTEHLDALRAGTLAVELRHALSLVTLPKHHKDPFDRLLIAQAMEEDLTLVSRDSAFAPYAVKRVW